jgi:hypothetical protein
MMMNGGACMMSRFLLLAWFICNVSALKSSWLPAPPRPQTSLRLVPLPFHHDVDITTANNQFSQLLVVDATHNNLNKNDRLAFGVASDLYRGIEALDSTNAIASAHPSSVVISADERTTESVAGEAGKWFFVLYVVVSLAAGFKEFGSRFQQWLQNRED